MVLYFYFIPIIIYILYYLVFKILSSFVRDLSYHDMYYKGCGLLCAHKKSFNTAIPVRSLGPYMYVHYCTCIVYILVWTYLSLFLSPSLSLYASLFLSLALYLCCSSALCLSVCLSLSLSVSLTGYRVRQGWHYVPLTGVRTITLHCVNTVVAFLRNSCPGCA